METVYNHMTHNVRNNSPVAAQADVNKRHGEDIKQDILEQEKREQHVKHETGSNSKSRK